MCASFRRPIEANPRVVRPDDEAGCDVVLSGYETSDTDDLYALQAAVVGEGGTRILPGS
jgi:hypothetical protein